MSIFIRGFVYSFSFSSSCYWGKTGSQNEVEGVTSGRVWRRLLSINTWEDLLMNKLGLGFVVWLLICDSVSKKVQNSSETLFPYHLFWKGWIPSKNFPFNQGYLFTGIHLFSLLWVILLVPIKLFVRLPCPRFLLWCFLFESSLFLQSA